MYEKHDDTLYIIVSNGVWWVTCGRGEYVVFGPFG